MCRSVLRMAVSLAACSMCFDQAEAQEVLKLVAGSTNASDLTLAIQRSVVPVVFINVLLQQLGLPLPAVPTMLIAGSLAASHGRVAELVAVAALASIGADALWYAAGRIFGYRVLTSLCRMLINPASCVTTAEALFFRWGAWSLIVAKFVPGFSTLGPPLAGALRLSLSSFLVASAIGATIWAGLAILTGWIWRSQVRLIVEMLTRNGAHALVLLALILIAWVTRAIWRRRRF